MTDSSEIWNAFGSDSSSSSSDDDAEDGVTNSNKEFDGDVPSTNVNLGPGSQAQQQQQQPGRTTEDHDLVVPSSLVAATDAALLQITSHFLRLSKSGGVPLRDRVVGVGIDGDKLDDELKKQRFNEMVAERIRSRGMKILDPVHQGDKLCLCDAAMFIRSECLSAKNGDLSRIKRLLLPGGSLWMVIAIDGNRQRYDTDTTDNDSNNTIENRIHTILDQEFPTSIWSTMTIIPHSTPNCFRVVHLQKHSCVINAWSCPWMNKTQNPPINHRLISAYNFSEVYLPIIMNSESEAENYLQYERRVTSAVTIVPSVKERSHYRCHCDSTTSGKKQVQFATMLTEEHVQQASEMLQKHGLVIIKGLLSPSQTVPWGKAVLFDFQLAVSRLKCHPTRPVDLLNPQSTSSLSGGGDKVFEPLSYKEMAMREDLRVDLRSGPEMEKLRKTENEFAVRSMKMTKPLSTRPQELGYNNGPTMILADVVGTVDSWRFHPSILAIIKQVFNPRKESFYKGNFGRWNFGGSGPDGTPQPFRLGQVGSVISCPGSADQAIHADTPHLYEHEDCLPCHYLNVFTPGYQVVDDPNDDCVEQEFCDGIWTGNSTLGGTAFVYGSHKLSVSAQLLSEDEDGTGWKGSKMGRMDNAIASSVSASMRKKMLWLRTLRPSLEAGDVLIFDCRTIHFGLANTSRGDQLGRNVNAGRRPMLYANVTQSWFHDPKNWDDREKIFD